MINIFDRTLKILARNHAGTFLRLAFPNHNIQLLGTEENIEISLSVKPVDFIHRVLYNGKQYLFHLEFQLTHKTELLQRTFITSAELTDQFNLPVLTVFLYLQPRGKDIPSSYTTKLDDTIINEFKYPVVKLWDYVEQIRQGNYRELAPFLVMLVKQPDETLLAEERELILQEEDTQKRADLLASAIAVGSRHFAKDFLWKFFREEVEQMKTATFIDDWITEGIEKGFAKGHIAGMQQGIQQGMQQGIQQGMQRGIVDVLETRFGEMSQPFIQSISNLDNPTRLNSLLTKAATAVSVAEFKQVLEGYDTGLRTQPNVLETQKILQTVREDVIEVLMIRFGELPKLLVKTIKLIGDLALLRTLHRKAITIESVPHFEQLLIDLLPDETG
jgi:flagellar biosynthesis/type III secretory pathway protein FliH